MGRWVLGGVQTQTASGFATWRRSSVLLKPWVPVSEATLDALRGSTSHTPTSSVSCIFERTWAWTSPMPSPMTANRMERTSG